MAYDFLVVDGSATMRAVIKRTIRVTGLPVGGVVDGADGAEALDVLANHRVDLIVADLHLSDGDGDGVETIGRILTEPATRAVPVVVVSANPDMDRVRKLRRAGAKGYLRKPFTPEALRDVLARILEPTHV